MSRGLRKPDSIYSKLKNLLPSLKDGADYDVLYLADQCRCAVNSVYGAVHELEREGLVKQKKGFGKVTKMRPVIYFKVWEKYSELWDYLHAECNFIALQSQMDDIVEIVKKILFMSKDIKTKLEILSEKSVYVSETEITGLKKDILDAMDEYADQFIERLEKQIESYEKGNR